MSQNVGIRGVSTTLWILLGDCQSRKGLPATVAMTSAEAEGLDPVAYSLRRMRTSANCPEITPQASSAVTLYQ